MAKLPRATKDALARRAVMAADYIERWAEMLEDEIKRLEDEFKRIGAKIESPVLWEMRGEMRRVVEAIREYSRKGIV
jgi:hypothetical protein